MDIELEANERIDDLEFKNLKIIQNKDGFCFGIDSVLLSDFAKNIKKRRNRFRDSFGVCGYSRIVPRFCKHSESAGATSSCLAGSKFVRFIVQARTAF